MAGAKNRHPPPLAVIRSCDTAAPRRSVRIEEQLGSKAPEMLVLYNAPHSTCSQKVRLCLAEKKLPFKEIKLDLGAGKDHLKLDYLKLNPNGVVPTLVDDGRPIVDFERDL